MRRAVRGGMLTSTLLALLAATPARSATPDPAEREAQARFEEGLSRVRDGDFDAARVSFAQAYAMLHRPNILWNLALCEDKTGRSLDALTHFKLVARDPSATDSDRADAKRHVDALMTHTGHVDVKAPAGTALTVDGGPYVGSTPLGEPLDLLPGHHVVEARLAQGAQSSAVEVTAGQTVQVVFPLGTGRTMEQVAATGPSLGATDPSPGTSAVDVGAASRSTSSEFGNDRWNRSDGPSTARIVTTSAVGGAAVVALGLGVYLALQSQSEANTASSFRRQGGAGACVAPTDTSVQSTCGKLSDAVKSENRDAAWSTGLYIAGGVLAAGAVATWFLWPKERKEAGSARMSPWIGPGTCGLAAAGQF